METITKEDFSVLLKRANLTVPQQDVETLKRMFEGFMERLKVLHSVDLQQEEIAGCFSPSGPQYG